MEAVDGQVQRQCLEFGSHLTGRDIPKFLEIEFDLVQTLVIEQHLPLGYGLLQ